VERSIVRKTGCDASAKVGKRFSRTKRFSEKREYQHSGLLLGEGEKGKKGNPRQTDPEDDEKGKEREVGKWEEGETHTKKNQAAERKKTRFVSRRNRGEKKWKNPPAGRQKKKALGKSIEGKTGSGRGRGERPRF